MSTDIMKSDLIVIARFTNETTYIEEEVDYLIGMERQNTTFTVKEILFHRDPSMGSKPLDEVMDIQEDGTMVVHKSTVVTCCLCGRSMSAQNIGQDYLLEISKYGDSFNDCDATCRIDGPSGLCADTATELRQMSMMNELEAKCCDPMEGPGGCPDASGSFDRCWDEGGYCCSDGRWYADDGGGGNNCQSNGLEDSNACEMMSPSTTASPHHVTIAIGMLLLVVVALQ